jgi:hypothetical protein
MNAANQIQQALANHRRPPRASNVLVRDALQHVNLGTKQTRREAGLEGVSLDKTGVISSEHNQEGGSRCVSLV